MASSQITAELFTFFRELRRNNDRDWFTANKDRFETVVRDPLLQFIREFDFRLRAISPNFVADPRRSGGSLFRINRDIRFSKDKSPYKTAAGIQFRHTAGRDVHAPGFYLHLEPAGCFAAYGIWRPDSPTLLKIRRAIVQRPDDWAAALPSSSGAGRFQFGGDSLKRPPKGFDPTHPRIEDLKRKDYVLFHDLQDEQLQAAGFIDEFASMCREGTPFMRFLTDAVGLAW
jgi:uncharacterized protein (TIGR02453 family)